MTSLTCFRIRSEIGGRSIAYTELRLYLRLGEVGNRKEEECSFTVVPSCSRFGKSQSGGEGAIVIWKALRSAQGVRQDQWLDAQILALNGFEQIVTSGPTLL